MSSTTKNQIALILTSFFALGLHSAHAACPYSGAPTQPGDVSDHLLPLSYPFGLQIYNLYWSDHWDRAAPPGLSKAEIDGATQELIHSGYFDRACQYGVPTIQWAGSNDTDHTINVCTKNPDPTLIPDNAIYDFAACEEAAGHLVTAKGIPQPACASCDVTTAGHCWSDPTCFTTPNASGDTIINIFLPQGTVPFGARDCNAHGYHLMVPSNEIGELVFGTGVPGTQGRPLYIAIIPTQCNQTLAELMATVSHEDIEAATDPFPEYSWLGGVSLQTEVADLCEGQSVTYQPLCGGAAFNVDSYWSNYDHACMAVASPPPPSCGAQPCGTIADGCGGQIQCPNNCGAGFACYQDSCVDTQACRAQCDDDLQACRDSGELPRTCAAAHAACIRGCARGAALSWG